MELPPYVVLDKAVGQTPLQSMEVWRQTQPSEYANLPLTYAGRLDPMASGKLLVLIGEECKRKEQYLALDKTYQFSVLLGIGSDTHDVLGRLHTDTFLQTKDLSSGALRATWPSLTVPDDLSVLETQLRGICEQLTGAIELPYPHFSSKTVQGKPLHMWTLEGRLHEISIPTKTSTIYSLQLDNIETKTRAAVCAEARAKIDTIPEVTETSKTLGNNFRRVDVRQDWKQIKNWPTSDVGQLDWYGSLALPELYKIAHFTCVASSGTYMRTLAKLIGQKLTTPIPSLAWSIHRTQIGVFNSETQRWGKEF
jgi:tRNA U55 pseudouridine synthase TruB